jgi:hypothetical protein
MGLFEQAINRARSDRMEKFEQNKNAITLSLGNALVVDDRTVFQVKQKYPAEVLSAEFRILELEVENIRLQQLVAELLIRNQQLRHQLCAGVPALEAAGLS